MIKIKINNNGTQQILDEINKKVAGLKTLSTQRNMAEVAKVAFTVTGKRFVQSLDREAAMNPKKYHHIYEWGRIGSSDARLFVLERGSVLGGNLVINSKFLPSRKPVPIPSGAMEQGSNGRRVTKRNIFKDKAKIMESGLSVNYTAKSVLAFLGRDGMVFLPKGYHVHINNPGGTATTNAFKEFMIRWYSTYADQVMISSGFYNKLAQDVARTLNIKGTGPNEVYTTVARTSSACPESLNGRDFKFFFKNSKLSIFVFN